MLVRGGSLSNCLSGARSSFDVVCVTVCVTVCAQLETDERILEEKATAALRRYNVDAVVANVLHTRYDVVRVFSRRRGGDAVTAETLRRSADTPLLDTAIAASIAGIHDAGVREAGEARGSGSGSEGGSGSVK